MARNTLVTLNQDIEKRRQNRQIWYVNDGVMLQCKAMQLKHLQATKDSNQGLNDYFVITISLVEIFLKKKKKKGKNWRKIYPNY